MKNWLTILLLLLALIIGGYFVVVRLVLPDTASAFAPLKWRHVPLGQSRDLVAAYLGPAYRLDSSQGQWKEEINSMKYYQLEIRFNDSVAVWYELSYHAKLPGFTQTTILKTDSLRH